MPAPHTRMHAQILHTSCCDMLFMPISIVYFDNDDPRGLSVKHGNIVGIVEEDTGLSKGNNLVHRYL